MQRTLSALACAIVTQTIHAAVIDNPHVDWQPIANTVAPAAVSDSDRPAPAGAKVRADREPDTRHAKLLGVYQAERLADPYSPTAPTFVARRKYPTSDAFAADIPNILTGRGFSPERAQYLASHITVDPSRGAGHAWGAFEISGVALVDMRVWRWMYAHPQAAPAELREATLQIARESGTSTSRRRSGAGTWSSSPSTRT